MLITCLNLTGFLLVNIAVITNIQCIKKKEEVVLGNDEIMNER